MAERNPLTPEQWQLIAGSLGYIDLLAKEHTPLRVKTAFPGAISESERIAMDSAICAVRSYDPNRGRWPPYLAYNVRSRLLDHWSHYCRIHKGRRANLVETWDAASPDEPPPFHEHDVTKQVQEMVDRMCVTLGEEWREFICRAHGVLGRPKCTVAELAREIGVSRSALSMRLNRGLAACVRYYKRAALAELS